MRYNLYNYITNDPINSVFVTNQRLDVVTNIMTKLGLPTDLMQFELQNSLLNECKVSPKDTYIYLTMFEGLCVDLIRLMEGFYAVTIEVGDPSEFDRSPSYYAEFLGRDENSPHMDDYNLYIDYYDKLLNECDFVLVKFK